MNILIQICIAVACIFFIWRIYKVIQANPQIFSKENVSKSFTTMGVLGLILVGGVALLVIIVKNL